VGWTHLAKPKPTFTHGNGREPSRKKTTWETSFDMESVIRKDVKSLNGGPDWKAQWLTGRVRGLGV